MKTIPNFTPLNKEGVLRKYYKYVQTARVTTDKRGINRITGCGMILNIPMSDAEMDRQINKQLNK